MMKVKKLIPDNELKEFAKFCDTHTVTNGTYAEAYLKHGRGLNKYDV